MDEGEEEDQFEVWADNWPALALFFNLGTQWRQGEFGVTGLHYEALPFLMKCHGIDKKDRADMLTDLRTCERAALDAWSKKRG